MMNKVVFGTSSKGLELQLTAPTPKIEAAWKKTGSPTNKEGSYLDADCVT